MIGSEQLGQVVNACGRKNFDADRWSRRDLLVLRLGTGMLRLQLFNNDIINSILDSLQEINVHGKTNSALMASVYESIAVMAPWHAPSPCL